MHIRLIQQKTHKISSCFLGFALCSIVSSLCSQPIVAPLKSTNKIIVDGIIIEIVKEKANPDQNPPPPPWSNGMNSVLHIKGQKNEFYIRPYEIESGLPMFSPNIISLNLNTLDLVVAWPMENGKIGGESVYRINIGTKKIVKIADIDSSSVKYMISPQGNYLAYALALDGYSPDIDWSTFVAPIYWGAIEVKSGKQTQHEFTPPRNRDWVTGLTWQSENILRLKMRHTLKTQKQFSPWKFVDVIHLEQELAPNLSFNPDLTVRDYCHALNIRLSVGPVNFVR